MRNPQQPTNSAIYSKPHFWVILIKRISLIMINKTMLCADHDLSCRIETLNYYTYNTALPYHIVQQDDDWRRRHDILTYTSRFHNPHVHNRQLCSHLHFIHYSLGSTARAQREVFGFVGYSCVDDPNIIISHLSHENGIRYRVISSRKRRQSR